MNISEKLTTIAENQQKVFDAGVKSEYDRFWDNYQKNGEPMSYAMAFGSKWDDITFKPKYPIIATGNGNSMFFGNSITNLKAKLEECNVYLDTSEVTTFSDTFAYSKMTHIPEISTISASKVASPFGYAQSLHTIDKLILKDDGSQTFGAMFSSCTALENIVIEGKIGQNGFDVHWSTKLTHDSLMSIINALKDYSGTGTTHTVTLGSANLSADKLSDAEKAIATQKGWTLA